MYIVICVCMCLCMYAFVCNMWAYMYFCLCVCVCVEVMGGLSFLSCLVYQTFWVTLAFMFFVFCSLPDLVFLWVLFQPP